MKAAPEDVPTAEVLSTNWEAAPTLPVAVKVTGEPASDPEEAVNELLPAAVPRVHEVSAAMPEESVVTADAGSREPPPEATVKVTETPETAFPPESVTRTDGAEATALPAVALWLLPPLRAIVVAAPTVTVTDWVAVVSELDE